ncbi:uncharacterized protein LOC135352465 [Halichondria panicea]|uniref:uncharacterized protein LOC135352465 n=1 Tax=Halichondria panicea TaxID=6063 RepID=UPI00312B6257
MCVQLDHLPVGSIVTVALTTQPLTATEDEDYLSLTATLEWYYDSPSVVQCVSVPIINDECVEEKEEVFIISLSTEQACVQLGANLTTVTIQDDDVLVLDLRPVGVVSESNGTVDTCIYVCDGQLKRNSSIIVSFWNGTAQYPADFARPLLTEEVVLRPNNTGSDLCFSVEVVDDRVYEELEYLQVALSTEDESVQFKESSVTLDIVDNDCVNITLSRELYAVSERDGFVEVCVSLEGETEVTVEASVFTIAGSAQAE